jgi:SulP family sulfate permease
MMVLGEALPTLNATALGVGVACAAAIFLLRQWRPNWPAMLLAVVATSLATALLHLPVETIGTRFGELPHGFPKFHIPIITTGLILHILPAALSFTLLGGIESLLSAKVADSMTSRKHRSNMELVAQGIANIASALFGGISVTGTIARTATNIRAGAAGPMSGMIHAAFLLVFILVAASLASYVPLTALAGVLVVVCWNMIERKEVAHMTGDWRNGAILAVTFALTLIRDLTAGIAAGCIVAALLTLLPRKRG